MSLINDALKQAQKNQSPTPAAGSPPPLKMAPPVQPATTAPAKTSSSRALLWVVFAIAIVGIAAVVFIAGWATAGRNRPAAEPVALTAPPPANVSAPAVAEPVPALPEPVKVVESPQSKSSLFIKATGLPRLQGIFYVPGKSTAILDGKTVRAGERCGDYLVKEIAKASVILTAADGSSVQLKMIN